MSTSKHIPPPERAKINQFAIRCFRDTGDADYIAARLAIRAHLPGPFLWSAEQAIEKYLKCILMLNRQGTKRLSHDIKAALERINTALPFVIELSREEQEVFDHIARCEGDRYLIISLSVDNDEVLHLDRLVWRLRQYCQSLDVLHYADAPSRQILLSNVRRIEGGMAGPAKAGHLPGAYLEKVLANRDHAAHNGLVWQNLYFSLSNRKGVMFQNGFQAINAPLWLNPELAEEAGKLMKVDDHILAAAHRLAQQRQEEVRMAEQTAAIKQPPID